MPHALAEQITEKLRDAAQLYYRLLLVVGPNDSGKTMALQDVARETGARLVNLNLEVSQLLLDLTERQRSLELPKVLERIVGPDQSVVLIYNIEILFDVSLEQDPLRLLQLLSRNRTVVAAWNGLVHNGHLVYATPGHLEYRRYSSQDLVLICAEVTT